MKTEPLEAWKLTSWKDNARRRIVKAIRTSEFSYTRLSSFHEVNSYLINAGIRASQKIRDAEDVTAQCFKGVPS